MITHFPRQVYPHGRHILAARRMVDNADDRTEQNIVIDFLDHGQMTAFQHDQGADRIDPNRPDEGRDQGRVKLGAALVIKLAQS